MGFASCQFRGLTLAEKTEQHRFRAQLLGSEVRGVASKHGWGVDFASVSKSQGGVVIGRQVKLAYDYVRSTCLEALYLKEE